MICILSGGGQKYKVAYLNYSSFLPYSESTPHVLCVFIKPRDVIEYRKRYPEHILVELPPASDSLFVGDARHWIMAFVTQLRLNDAARCDAAPQRFFARCFMLDDDVTCVHRGDVPVTLAVMLQEMSKKIESMDTPPLLVGVHCRSGRSPSAEWWVADGPTPLATALSVSTDVNIQLDVHFHPLAQLGEDVDFDQRLRLAAPEERVGALKCNLFSYTRASSGNDVGADRVPTEFASMLVKVMEEIGFDPMQRVDVTGTYPLLKDIHGWSWQKVTLKEERRPFKDTRFLFTRPGGLNHLHAVSQGVLLRISDDDLPHSSPINWVTTETTFRLKLKLKGSGLMIMPLEDVPLNVRNGTEILGRAPLNVPWQAQGHDPTMYAFIKVEAAAAAAPSLQLPKATQKLPLLETVAVGFRISLYDAPPRPTSWEGVQKEAARQAAEAQVASRGQARQSRPGDSSRPRRVDDTEAVGHPGADHRAVPAQAVKYLDNLGDSPRARYLQVRRGPPAADSAGERLWRVRAAEDRKHTQLARGVRLGQAAQAKVQEQGRESARTVARTAASSPPEGRRY